MVEQTYKKYLLQYYHDGAHWDIILHATSKDDARERARQIYYAKVLGTVEREIPASVGGWLPRMICWVRNHCLFATGRSL